MNERIQLHRTYGWRKPDGAIVVSRPSRWGNPYGIADVVRRFPSLTEREAAAYAVNQFRYDLRSEHPSYPSDEEIRAELGGHDLCCWCPPDYPCHADVLLEIANSEPAARSGQDGA